MKNEKGAATISYDEPVLYIVSYHELLEYAKTQNGRNFLMWSLRKKYESLSDIIEMYFVKVGPRTYRLEINSEYGDDLLEDDKGNEVKFTSNWYRIGDIPKKMKVAKFYNQEE